MSKETIIKVNGKTVLSNGYFAYDNIYKIYILEDDLDLENAKNMFYPIFPIEKLQKTYNNSYELRFISNWKLTKRYVAQFENAEFNIIENI